MKGTVLVIDDGCNDSNKPILNDSVRLGLPEGQTDVKNGFLWNRRDMGTSTHADAPCLDRSEEVNVALKPQTCTETLGPVWRGLSWRGYGPTADGLRKAEWTLRLQQD